MTNSIFGQRVLHLSRVVLAFSLFACLLLSAGASAATPVENQRLPVPTTMEEEAEYTASINRAIQEKREHVQRVAAQGKTERKRRQLVYPAAVFIVGIASFAVTRRRREAVTRALTWAPVLSSTVVLAFEEMWVPNLYLLSSALFYAGPLLLSRGIVPAAETKASIVIYLALATTYLPSNTVLAWAAFLSVAIAAVPLVLALLVLRRHFRPELAFPAMAGTIFGHSAVVSVFLWVPSHFKGMDAAYGAGAGAALVAMAGVVALLASLVLFPIFYWIANGARSRVAGHAR